MRTVLIPLTAVVVLLAGCSEDSGPILTGTATVEAGKADTVRTEIRMNAGELQLEGGASRLLDATFRYSQNAGRPVVHYDVMGGRGLLTVESPENGSTRGRNATNEWTLRMGSDLPLDLSVHLGAGESRLDVSQLALRSAEVNMGAGNMTFNMANRYTQDVNVQINGGVGEAHIRLPKETGAVVDATGGIGSVQADGLTKRGDGKYYNAAYADDKPAVHMKVRGGVGDIILE
ncbi:MAG TPA: toast rack family protein [Bryobacteraceae bacterium]|nr:toast rack family protein [Bryobacteraceae bacterium]